MKIWLVSCESQPAAGAASCAIAHTAEALASAGCSVTLLTPGDSAAEQITPSGVRILSSTAGSHQMHPSDDQTDSHPAYPANILSH